MIKNKWVIKCSIISLIVLLIFVLLGGGKFFGNTSNEKLNMKKYLENKYKQEFSIGEIQEFNRGFAAGKLLQARAMPDSNKQIDFVVSRESNQSNYEDSYREVLLEKFAVESFMVNDLHENLKYYIKIAYEGGFNSDEEIKLNKLNPSFIIALPVEPPFNSKDYVGKIQRFINNIEQKEVGSYRVRIDFIDNKHRSFLREYFDLSQRDLTQIELKEQNYSGVKSQYENNIIGRFIYDSNEVEFSNSPYFIEGLFVE